MILWVRKNFLALVVLVAIGASFVITDHESISRDRVQHDQLIAGCQRGSYQKAMGAVGWQQAAATRRAQGQEGPAQRYDAVAQGMIDTIPAPSGFGGSSSLAAATLIRRSGEKPRYVLTAQAQRLQKQGCALAFP